MASFLDAIILSGPNKGKTIRECITANFVAPNKETSK
jgi:hypothetical protein